MFSQYLISRVLAWNRNKTLLTHHIVNAGIMVIRGSIITSSTHLCGENYEKLASRFFFGSMIKWSLVEHSEKKFLIAPRSGIFLKLHLLVLSNSRSLVQILLKIAKIWIILDKSHKSGWWSSKWQNAELKIWINFKSPLIWINPEKSGSVGALKIYNFYIRHKF